MKTVKTLCAMLCVMLLAVLPATAQNTDKKNKAIIETSNGSRELNTDDIQLIRFDGGKITVVQPWGETTFDHTLRSLSFLRPNPGTLHLTASTSISTEGGNRAQAIDGEGDLVSTWQSGDVVYVYANESTTTNIGTLTPKSYGARTSTLTGDIDAEGLSNGQTLYFSTKDRSTLDLSTQDGTIEGLFYFTATGTVSIVGANATISNLSFTRPIAIVKFTLKDKADGTTPVNAKSLTVNDGTSTYTVTPATATDELFVGIPGFRSKTVNLEAFDGFSIYSYEKAGVTFADNGYYAINVKMTNTTLSVPLTFEAMEDGTNVSLYVQGNTLPVLYYKVNNEGWTALSFSSDPWGLGIYYESDKVSINEGDKVSFRGNNTTLGYQDGCCKFKLDHNCYLYGNVMSLLDKNNYPTNKTLTADYTFRQLFSQCSIYNHPSKPIMLPATTLTKGCYELMFYGVTTLTTPPVLPATTLADECYHEMFEGCSSLTSAPELPATTMVDDCYYSMFLGCTSLSTAPDLPATTLAKGCYYNMFYGCTRLTTAPKLPAATLAESCYNNMFKDCSNLTSITCLATDISAENCTNDWLDVVAYNGTFTKAASMTGWTENSASGIPSGWTVEDYIPNVPLTLEAKTAGTIAITSPKSGMQYTLNGGDKTAVPASITVAAGDIVQFYGNGTSITSYDGTQITGGTADCYVYGNIMSLVDENGFATATTVAESAFRNLFKDNTHLLNHTTKTLLLPATTLADYCYNSMFMGCTGLTKVPELPATTLADNCYNSMFMGCTSLSTVPLKLPAETLTDGCYQNMFSGCTNLTTAPVLPAQTLVSSCYKQMFDGCTSLSSVTCIAIDISASECTNNWLNGVAADGTFTKATSTTGWTAGASGIPSGWTVENYMLNVPLTFEAKTAGTIAIKNPKDGMQYTLNGAAKTAVPTSIAVAAGDIVQFYGNGTSITSYDGTQITGGTADCYVYGNIMSLVDENGFATATAVGATAFRNLFQNNTRLLNHTIKTLLLPATNLDVSCYYCMFRNCSGLTKAPDLPAKKMENYCYSNMFEGCTNLTTAPVLPATTLAIYCYNFMFYKCSRLNRVTCLATDISEERCTNNWLSGVAANGTFTKAASMNDWTTGTSGIPSGWTVEDTTP